MNTVFEVFCAHDDPGYAGQAAQAGFELVDRLEQEMSRFIANSDIARINALGAGRATRVSPWTMECLDIAWRMHALTAGAFDISIGSGLERLELRDGFEVRAREEGARLDLGGIGKGYAVDRVAELLGEWEVPRALIHGGFSSVLALDPPPGRDGWPLTLTVPGPGELAPGSRRDTWPSAPRAPERRPHPGPPGRGAGAGSGGLGGPPPARRRRRGGRRTVRPVAGSRRGGPLDRVHDPAGGGYRYAVRGNPGSEAWIARERPGTTLRNPGWSTWEGPGRRRPKTAPRSDDSLAPTPN